MDILKYALKGTAAFIAVNLLMLPITMIACVFFFLLPWTWRRER